MTFDYSYRVSWVDYIIGYKNLFACRWKVQVTVHHCIILWNHSKAGFLTHCTVLWSGTDNQPSTSYIILYTGITRGILESAGLPVPPGVVMVDGDEEAKYEGTFPAVVKPTHMENSVGVEMVQDAEEMKEVLEKTWDLYGDTAVVDKFIAGREVRCGTVELEPGVITPLGCIEYKVSRMLN